MYAEQVRTLSPTTVRQHHVVLKRARSEAVRAGLLARNPAEAVDSPRGSPPREPRALEQREIEALLAAAGDGRLAAPIRVSVATGVRQGELLAFRWRDIDLDGGTMTVTRSVGYVIGEGLKFSQTKTRNARRTIELSPATGAVLRGHRQQQRVDRMHIGPAWQDNDLVFPSSRGTPWSPRNFYRAYKSVVAATRISDAGNVDFHCLRHTAATQWIAAGADIHVVSRRLGHASPAFTMSVYGHLLKGMQQTAAEALDNVIG